MNTPICSDVILRLKNRHGHLSNTAEARLVYTEGDRKEHWLENHTLKTQQTCSKAHFNTTILWEFDSLSVAIGIIGGDLLLVASGQNTCTALALVECFTRFMEPYILSFIVVSIGALGWRGIEMYGLEKVHFEIWAVISPVPVKFSYSMCHSFILWTSKYAHNWSQSPHIRIVCRPTHKIGVNRWLNELYLLPLLWKSVERCSLDLLRIKGVPQRIFFEEVFNYLLFTTTISSNIGFMAQKINANRNRRPTANGIVLFSPRSSINASQERLVEILDI